MTLCCVNKQSHITNTSLQSHSHRPPRTPDGTPTSLSIDKGTVIIPLKDGREATMLPPMKLLILLSDTGIWRRRDF